MNVATGSILVQDLSKAYRLYDSPVDRLKESLHWFKKKYHTLFYALKDLDLTVRPGEAVGIIGKNGAGKSTFLKILTGVSMPTSGTLRVGGSISALLELGAGFNPELTGRANIFFSASVQGLTREEIAPRVDSIVAFADIGEFIDQPVKHYSSGMYVRLAFSVAIHVDPDILIVDEALSVGDIRFQQKCLRAIGEFQARGKTIIFVSHDMNAILTFCDRVLWLMDGKVFRQGPPKDIVKQYISYMSYNVLPEDEPTERGSDQPSSVVQEIDKRSASGASAPSLGLGGVPDLTCLETTESFSSFGDGTAVIERVGLFHALTLERASAISGGERLALFALVHLRKALPTPLFGFSVTDDKGNPITGSNTAVAGATLPGFAAGTRLLLRAEFEFPHVRVGDYLFSVAVGDGGYSDHDLAHWVHDACIIQVVSQDPAARIGHVVLLQGPKFSVRDLPASSTDMERHT